MPDKIRISIPKPCHENWDAMTPVEQGRFCSVCSKNVYDFTKLPDVTITHLLSVEKISCGKFSISQLNREIGNSNTKNSLWLACTAAVMSFFIIGIQEVNAQTKIVLHENNNQPQSINNNDALHSTESCTINGIVSDLVGTLPGAIVVNTDTGEETLSDMDGKFSIIAKIGDILKVSYLGYSTTYVTIENEDVYTISLYESDTLEDVVIDVYGGIEVRKPTFLGRIFRSIGNIFK